jgi:hypothetical protein
MLSLLTTFPFSSSFAGSGNNNDDNITVPETVVSETLPPENFPEFLLFDFIASGLASLDNELVEGFIARLRVAIALIRSENAV